MIEVERLTKYYGRLAAVKDVSFKVQTGEIVGFLGPNGAGKTTTIRILTCFSPASSGRATVMGMDSSKDSLGIRNKVGYLPENVPIYPWMRVKGYLRFVARAKGIPSSTRAREIDRVMDAVDLGQVRDRLIGTLSKGFRQRVGLAQALIGDPPVLILDEPTIGLDPRQIREIRGIIKGFSQDRTVILSTHILPEVSEVCDRVIIINKGSIVAEDTPENLTGAHADSSRRQIIVRASESEAKDFLSQMEGVSSVKCSKSDIPDTTRLIVESPVGRDMGPELAKAVVEKGWDLLELRALHASLEDVFIDLITEESPEAVVSDRPTGTEVSA